MGAACCPYNVTSSKVTSSKRRDSLRPLLAQGAVSVYLAPKAPIIPQTKWEQGSRYNQVGRVMVIRVPVYVMTRASRYMRSTSVSRDNLHCVICTAFATAWPFRWRKVSLWTREPMRPPNLLPKPVIDGARAARFGLHVGEHPLDGLEFTDGFAEGAALLAYFRIRRRRLGRADCWRDADAAAVEGPRAILRPGPLREAISAGIRSR